MGMSDFLKHISNILPEDEIENFKNACNLPLNKSIRFFRKAKSFKKIVGFKADYYKIEEKIPWVDEGFYLDNESRPAKSLDYIRGDFYIQDAASMYPVSAFRKYYTSSLDYQKNKEDGQYNKIILDYAASPGGKTTQLADYFDDSIIIANEVIKGRIGALYSNIIRSKLLNIILLNKNFDFFLKSNIRFDIILADLPCSGESLIYKQKVNIEDWNLKEVLFNSKRQKKICSDLLNLIKTQGFFIYSTCTFSKEENEDIVEFLIENKLSLIEEKRLWPHKDKCSGGYSAILENCEKGTFIDDISYCEKNKNIEYIEHQTPKLLKILSKSRFFDLEKIKSSGFLFQKDNIISIFSFSRIPKIFFNNAILIGLPICKIDKSDMTPLWNSIEFTKDEYHIKLEDEILYNLIKGEDLRKNFNNFNFDKNIEYFAGSDNESALFLLKKVENTVKNLIPNHLIIR